jgi:flagellar protein FliS
MTANNAYGQYKRNAALTSQPEDLVLMLYNGLIKFTMQAVSAVDETNVEKANNCILRAQDIVDEFLRTLDRSYEISKSMELMYDYMRRRLVDANIAKDKEILEEVLGLAKELRDTWEQAMKIAKQQNRQANKVASAV